MKHFSRLLRCLLLLLPLLAAACEKDAAQQNQGADKTGDGTDSNKNGGTDKLPNDSDIGTNNANNKNNGEPGVCGDGILDDDEACDDGNTVDGDGCSADCKYVDEGFSCMPPGIPCHRIAKCGDGHVLLPELCDDGNSEDGDGCSSRCQVEVGWKCDGSPSVCTPTVCGDGIVEGAETCDDGNTMPFDGCNEHCQVEPNCDQDGCTSRCGDGIILPPEECDDGNNIDGDGCSADCKVEEGFTCTSGTECEKQGDECVFRVTAVFRDFLTYGDPYGDFSGGGDLTTGLVAPQLVDGRPVLLPDAPSRCPSIDSVESFARWYTDGPNRETLVSSLVLYDNGQGAWVNRHGPLGEQWCADGTCYDGTPAFFPVDELANTDDRHPASIPPEYGGGWDWETEFVPDAPPHNFGFTSHVLHWFHYDPDTPTTLRFLGDDDLWVFVNGHLALDLGCVHVPESGEVVISSATEATFGLTPGGVYPISVFHAERNPSGSSFQLTLEGFNTSRSVCTPICGDGIVSLGEECDDGINEGGYGKCGPGCKLDAYCGDGIVQREYEECDDGNFINDDECPNSCRKILID